jgi:hypothetical protein
VQLLVAELAGATARLGAPCGLRIVRAEGASGETLEHTGQLVVLRPLQAARLLLAPL